jgi:hypothetical protein
MLASMPGALPVAMLNAYPLSIGLAFATHTDEHASAACPVPYPSRTYNRPARPVTVLPQGNGHFSSLVEPFYCASARVNGSRHDC